MPRAATAFVEFDGDFSKVSRSAGGQAGRLENTFNSSFKRIASFAAGALAGVGIGKFFKDAFSEAADAQKVGRQTNAVLKSTGGIARVTAKDVDTLANSLSAKAGVDDELIASGENVLLTFTNVRNEVGKGNDIFDQGATAALNMSAALGTDLQGSVIQVGKALNDPIKGVTALQRVGVSFTKSQKDQIKTLVETGHTLDAQKLILRELSAEFGGAAEAAASPTQKLGVAFKNIEESFGLLFLPLLNRVASLLTKTVAPAIERIVPVLHELAQAAIIAFEIGFGTSSIRNLGGWVGVIAKVGRVLRAFIDFVKGNVASAGVEIATVFGISEDDPRVNTFIKVFSTVRKVLVSVAQFVARNWKRLLIVGAAALLVFISPIVAVIAALLVLYVRFQFVRDAVSSFIGTVQSVSKFLSNIDWGAIFARVAADIASAIEVVRSVISAIVGFFTAHSKDFDKIGAGFLKVWQQIAPTVKAAFDAVVAVVRVALGIIVAVIAVGVAIITGFWDRFGQTLLDKLRIAFNAIVTIVSGAFQVIRGIFEIITGVLTGKWGKAWNGIKDVFAGVWKIIVGIGQFAINLLSTIIGAGVAVISEIWHGAWTGFKDVVKIAFDGVVDFFRQLPGRILGFIKAIGGAAKSIGSSILHGIIDGITGAVSFVVNIGKSIANAVIHFVNHIIGDINDALEFTVPLPFHKKFHINPPDIPLLPTFHTGGTVPGPSGSDVLALLKAGEFVFTPAQLNAITSRETPTGRVLALAVTTKVDGTGRLAALLQELFDEHDRELEHALAAGALVGAA